MFALGMDIGGTNLRVVILNKSLELMAKYAFELPSKRCRAELLRFIADRARQVAGDLILAGVGIGITGVIRRDRKLVTSNISVLNGLDPIPLFQEYLNAPVVADNDVRCALRGECHLGAARSCTDAACITLGTGIGGALLLDGRIRRGLGNSAGEIGLSGVFLNPKGLTTLESIWQDARPKATTFRGRSTSRESILSLSGVDPAVLGHLAAAVLSLHRTIELERIVFGGVATLYGKAIVEGIAQIIRTKPEDGIPFDCDLALAELGIYAGATGAACLVMEAAELIRRL